MLCDARPPCGCTGRWSVRWPERLADFPSRRCSAARLGTAIAHITTHVPTPVGRSGIGFTGTIMAFALAPRKRVIGLRIPAHRPVTRDPYQGIVGRIPTNDQGL
jgi:hypothetical protein